ncbi:MAG: hypothetical protein GPOALKHO_000814 [Sodalis sp.]|nr:MAG: hypothetical protein GPOALKHO_000814 [Sodalis sp.]
MILENSLICVVKSERQLSVSLNCRQKRMRLFWYAYLSHPCGRSGIGQPLFS